MRCLTLLMVVSAGLLAGCDNDPAHKGHDHADSMTAKELFEFHCSMCHGTKGWGNFLKGTPAVAVTDLSAGAIAHRVRDSRPVNSPYQMPVFQDMSQAEALKIAQYVQEIRAKAMSEE